MSRDEIRAALAEALVIAHEGRIAALTAENERLRADLVRAQVSALTGISEAEREARRPRSPGVGALHGTAHNKELRAKARG